MNLEIGNILRDNDPRQRGKRRAKIVHFQGGIHPGQTLEPHAVCEVIETKYGRGSRHTATIPLSKIHTDGKERKSGWDLEPVAEPVS